MVLARQPLSALALLLALALPAHATTYFASGFDLCATPTSADTNYWAVVNGTPSVTTSVESTTGNLCALAFDPASGGTEYLSPVAWAATSALRLTCRLRVTDTGGSGCKRELLSFVGSGGDWSGKAALLTFRHAGTAAGVDQYTLGAYYGSLTQLTCSGSPELGKQCTHACSGTDCATYGECSELRPGEAQCANTSFATSPVMNEGTTYAVTLTQDNGSGATAGTVTVGLYEGPAGGTSAVYSRGSAARIVGECSGGTNDLAPCNVASECPSGSCVVTNVVAPTTVRLGTSDTTSCAPAYTLDDCWAYDGDVRQNVRLETLYPNAAPTMDTNWDAVGSANGCASDADAWKCLSDGTSGPNGNDSALSNNNAAKPTVAINLNAYATPSAQPTPRAVAFEWVAQDTASGGSNSTTARLELVDDHGFYSGETCSGGANNGAKCNVQSQCPGGSCTTARAFDFESFAGTGGTSGSYYLAPPVYREAASDGSAWDFTSIDALQIVFNKTAGSGNEGRITSTLATVVLQTADPAVPTLIPDRDQDGEDTVCFVGDSTWDNVDFQNALVAGLVEPDNIYFYTRGGSQLGDTAAEWTALLEGSASTYMGLVVARGTSGKTCDVVFVSHVVNTVIANIPSVDPIFDTAWKGVAQDGYCEDQGGANQGRPCTCTHVEPYTSNLGTPAPNVTPGQWHCINNGDFLSTPVVFNGKFFCGCTTNADCTYGMRTPGPLHTPAPCQTTFGYCVDNVDASLTNVDAPPRSRTTFAATGCTNSPQCPGGFCMRRPGGTQFKRLIDDLVSATAARPTPNPAATPAGTSGPPILVWVPAPHLVLLDNLASPTAFDQAVPAFDRFRQLYRRQTYFADLLAYFRQRFPEHSCAASPCSTTDDATLALRDGVHWTFAGQLAAAQLLIDVLTVGGADGVCTGTVCTAGLVGDTCAANADCDLYRAGFTAP